MVATAAGPRRESLLIAAYVALSGALMVSFGGYSPAAVGLLFISLGCLWAVPVASPREAAPAWIPVTAAGFTALMALAYLNEGVLTAGRWMPEWAFVPLVIVLAGTAAWSARDTAGHRRIAVAIATLAAGLLIPSFWRFGKGLFDIHWLVDQAADDVLAGASIYDHLSLGLLVQRDSGALDTALIRFPYGPAVAILAAPGRLLGDIRLSSLVAALVILGTVIAVGRRRDRWWRTTALCLACPLTMGMVAATYADLYSVAGFALWVALRDRHWRLATLALGVAFLSKYTIAIGVLPFLWDPKARREVALAGGLAIAGMLPFAVASGLPALFDALVGTNLQVRRWDGLTLSSLLHAVGVNPGLPAALNLALASVISAVALRRRPRDRCDALATAALVNAVVYFLAPFAYFNYYFVGAAMLLMALTYQRIPAEATAPERHPGTSRARPAVADPAGATGDQPAGATVGVSRAGAPTA